MSESYCRVKQEPSNSSHALFVAVGVLVKRAPDTAAGRTNRRQERKDDEQQERQQQQQGHNSQQPTTTTRPRTYDHFES